MFVLEVDLDTMNRRIDERVALDPTDFGGKPEERDSSRDCMQRKKMSRRVVSYSMPLRRLNASWMRFWKSCSWVPDKGGTARPFLFFFFFFAFLPTYIDRSDLVQAMQVYSMRKNS